MAEPGAAQGRRLGSRLLGHDQPIDLAHVTFLFAGYVLLDLATRLLSNTDTSRLSGSALTWGAVETNPLAYLAAASAATLAAWRWPKRLLSEWTALEQGRMLRAMALAPVAILTWHGSFYEYNFLLEQSHLGDRVLLLLLAIGCVARPMFLAPYALQSLVIAEQFDHPFGTTATQNIDDLLVIVILALASSHLVFVVTGRRQTSPVVLLLSAAVATHFFVPGRSKLAIEWLSTTDLSHLPLSAYVAGWQAQGNAEWAQQMSKLARAGGRPLLLGTLVIELGSVIAVTHFRLMRLWLPVTVLFHVVLFAFTGFWFLSWVAVEIGLLAVLSRRRLRPWLEENLTPARALLTAGVVVLAGTSVFHPPRLAWLDAPVSYGYRIEATGQGGARYTVPISALAPFVQELTFFRLRLADTNPLTGGYGAIGDAARYERLEQITTFDQMIAAEGPASPEERALSQTFMMRFMDHANRRGPMPWSSISPPDPFWTASAEPQFDFQEPIDQLDVFVLRSIQQDGEHMTSSEIVLSLVVGPNGSARVATPSTSG
jgi:hypothetical protein